MGTQQSWGKGNRRTLDLKKSFIDKMAWLKGNTKFWYGVMNLVQMHIIGSICDPTIFSDRFRG